MREDPRTRHTRVGWWLMTHERESAWVFGVSSGLVLVADAAVASTRWHGAFRQAYLVAFGGLFTIVVVAGLSRIRGGSLRTRAHVDRAILVIAIIVLLRVNDRLHSTFGEALGTLAALAATLLVAAVVTETRRRRTAGGSHRGETQTPS